MEFYDYKTLPVNGTQVIDPNKTGMSFYDQFLTDKELDYLHNEKNLQGEIIMMSPEEYYEACSKYGFSSKSVSVDNLKRTRRADQNTLNHLKDVLLVYKRRFPLPMLNMAEQSQEGLHRMMVIGDLFGWDHKVPVLVITWYDEDRAKREAEAKHKYDIDYNVEKAIQETCYYTYYSVEEIAQQLQHELFRRFEYRDSIKVPDEIELKETPEGYMFTFEGYEYAIDKDAVELKDEEQDNLDDIDVEDLESTEDFLKRYFGDNWRETHPHLKDTFNMKESITESSEDTTIIGLGIKLRKEAEKGWTKDTCHPAYRDRWSKEHPSIGQCAITAMWLNETQGWDIYETIVDRSRHFFNKDTNGFVYDLTADQFQDSSIDYENNRERKFKDLYKSCADRYDLFKSNLTSNLNESVDRIDIEQMDKAIQYEFGSDTPGEGCIFIHPNGKFINIYPKLDDHEDLCYWLEELADYNFDTPEDAEWFVAEFGYVRCRNSSHMCFVEIPQKMTHEQYYSLEQWLEEKVSSDKIDIEPWSGDWKTYNLDDYFPEDIIKIIKRSYASGKLYD